MNDEVTNRARGREQHVVVGYLAETDCDAALERAFQLSHELAGRVAVHVVRALRIGDRPDVAELDAAFVRAKTETVGGIMRAIERVGEPAAPVHIDVTFGEPALAIEAAAVRTAATVVVIGQGAHGEVAGKLAERLRCTLLVATDDRYSAPEPRPRQEIASPDDPHRKPHVYASQDSFDCTFHVGPTRIY